MNEHRPGSALTRYFLPDLPAAAEILPYLEEMDRNQWYSNFGPLVQEFEKQLQNLLSVADTRPLHGQIHLTTIVSAHQALEIALRVLNLPRGGRVLVPAITFGGCPLAVQHAGLTAVMTDVDPVSWTLTPQIAKAAASRFDIAAVMPVALYGVPLPTDEWDAFTEDTGIPVVIDAAAAGFEVQSSPRRGMVAYSLHATKPFGIGEGGVLAGRDPLLIEFARRQSNFGMVEKIVHSDGTNGKMSEFHAAVALAQMKRWPRIKEKRAQLLSTYERHLRRLSDVVSFQSSLHAAVVAILMLKCKDPVAERVVDAKREHPIAFHRAYLPPLYRHPRFENLPVVDTEGLYMAGTATRMQKYQHMRNCELLARHLVGVPFHVFMSEQDVEVVVEELTTSLDPAIC